VLRSGPARSAPVRHRQQGLPALAIAPDNRLRFPQIKYGVTGISQRLLTLTLGISSGTGCSSVIVSPGCRRVA
jgi:hypothetical protein